jgi:hypothetical protein
VAVAESEFHSVSTDVLGVQNSQLLGDSSRVEYSQSGNFADAIGAGALGPEELDGKDADMLVIPADSYFATACLLYFKWYWN